MFEYVGWYVILIALLNLIPNTKYQIPNTLYQIQDEVLTAQSYSLELFFFIRILAPLLRITFETSSTGRKRCAPGRASQKGWTNGRIEVTLCYRTLYPLGPLPCISLSMKKKRPRACTMQGWETGFSFFYGFIQVFFFWKIFEKSLKEFFKNFFLNEDLFFLNGKYFFE